MILQDKTLAQIRRLPMHILIPAWLWLIHLMYKCLKKTSERFSFAVRGLKVGVLGIAGNHRTVTVQ
jgi:hypothetical protein